MTEVLSHVDHHQRGQVYESAGSGEKTYLLIGSIDHDAGTARVTYPAWAGRHRNRRLRTVRLASLHSADTRLHTGYRLLCEAPRPGQGMCGECFHYFGFEDLTQRSLCAPCDRRLTEQFPTQRMTKEG